MENNQALDLLKSSMDDFALSIKLFTSLVEIEDPKAQKSMAETMLILQNRAQKKLERVRDHERNNGFIFKTKKMAPGSRKKERQVFNKNWGVGIKTKNSKSWNDAALAALGYIPKGEEFDIKKIVKIIRNLPDWKTHRKLNIHAINNALYVQVREGKLEKVRISTFKKSK